MHDLRRIYRIFQMIARMRSPIGCSKKEMAESFGVNVRTIDRYIALLKDLGFEVRKHQERFRIHQVERSTFKHEDLIVFSLEEAATIKEAVLSSKIEGLLQKSLLDKLYALTDLDELADSLYKQSISRNISDIRFAMKYQKQILLKGYESVSSEKKYDRLVEPIRFHNYYRYLLAFEPESKQVKQFKTERIPEVVITDKPMAYKNKHGEHKIDIFGMSGDDPVPVKLCLSKRAKMLLEEEFPDAALHIRSENGLFCFEGSVYDLAGIGRFILGLINEVQVSHPPELIEYINSKVESFRAGVQLHS